MKILIIGSDGFIGSNVVKYFKLQGFNVYCADITLKEEDNYQVINAEFPNFSKLFYQQKFDVCINASGAANVQFSYNNSALDYTLNVSNVYHILDSIRTHNPQCKFINFSSAAVYGNPESLPIKETSFTNPLSPYGWHKMQSEQVCKEFSIFFNVSTINLRVFSAFGPGLKKQLFWDLYQKSLTNQTVSIYGTGNESRDFIYISDLVRVVDLAIKNAEFKGECINVANGEEIYIKDVAQTYFELLDKSYSFSGNIKIGDPKNWVADISKIKSWGYYPQVSIKDGLHNYIKWVKGQN